MTLLAKRQHLYRGVSYLFASPNPFFKGLWARCVGVWRYPVESLEIETPCSTQTHYRQEMQFALHMPDASVNRASIVNYQGSSSPF